VARSESETLARIREAVLSNRYVITPHAWREMRDDGLELPDVESVLLTGRIDHRYPRDPRGTRWRVVGVATDLTTEVAVVVRFVLRNQLLVITTFVVEKDHG